jgi:hypothetical protein
MIPVRATERASAADTETVILRPVIVASFDPAERGGSKDRTLPRIVLVPGIDGWTHTESAESTETDSADSVDSV